MLSLQTKQLQGALSLDLAVLARLQARTPHPVFTHPPSNTPPPPPFPSTPASHTRLPVLLSVCQSSVVHRYSTHCGTVAMQHPMSLQLQSQSHL